MSTEIVYPIITTWVTGNEHGYMGDPQPTPNYRVWHRLNGCCFGDLLNPDEDDQDLAGMGLCIIGNLCKAMGAGLISHDADAKLELQLAPKSPAIPLPWPGMPDDRPVPLDVTQLPMDNAMFLESDTENDRLKAKYRVDRIAVMRRIHTLWVPYIQEKLGVKTLAAGSILR